MAPLRSCFSFHLSVFWIKIYFWGGSHWKEYSVGSFYTTKKNKHSTFQLLGIFNYLLHIFWMFYSSRLTKSLNGSKGEMIIKIYGAAHLSNNCIFDKFLSIEQVTSFFYAAIIWIGWVTCWGTGSIPISKPVDLI